MKNIKRALCGLLAALTVSSAIAVPAAANETEQTTSTTPDVYIIETTEETEAVFERILALDENAELLYEYSEALDGFSLRTSLSAEELSALTSGVVHISYRCSSASYETETMAFTASDILGASAVRSSVGLRGEGMVAAVIDAAFDVTHPMLSFSPEEEAALADKFAHTEETIAEAVNDGLRSSNRLRFDKKSPYVNQKIPYAYDYVHMDNDVYLATEDHGTAVASVIAGNSDENDKRGEGFDGIAPDAQLLLMKISDDRDGTIDDYSILAAIDDAISLGADVINLSFGKDSGFVNVNAGSIYFTAIGRARSKGIDIFCAAGNEGKLGAGSTWDVKYGIDSPDVLNPDYGRVASPSTLNSSISVASINNEYYNINEYIEYVDAKTGLKHPLLFQNGVGSDICSTLGGRSFEFVVIGGIGNVEDFGGRDLTGKIAVIERGTITFEEKINNAAALGAVGVIIYDNVEDQALVNMGYEGEIPIPAVFVSRKDGLMLVEGKTRTLTVSKSGMSSFESPIGGQMSAFSSYGPTPMLTLKPDITAVGGTVRAASNDGGYILTSGTSFSSPIAAGCALLLAQTVDKSDPAIGVEYVERMLMSTADPITDHKSGYEYSPRRQGAGLIDLESAVVGGAYITGSTGHSKLELGDNLGSEFELSFTVRNFTESTLSWYVDASLLTDSWWYDEETNRTFIDDKSYAVKSANIVLMGENGPVSGRELNRYAKSYKQNKRDVITVGPLATSTFTLKINAAGSEYDHLCEVFENGFYEEGFVRLTPADIYSPELNVPYLGFSANWAKAPIFDEEYAPSYLTSYLKLDNSHIMLKLGENTFLRSTNSLEPDGQPDAPIPNAISPDGNDYGDLIGMSFANVRNIYTSYYAITDANGEVIFTSGKGEPMQKAVIGVDAIKYNGTGYIWDGRDTHNPSYLMPEGDYTITLIGTVEYEDAEEQYLSIPFIIDRTDCELLDTRVYTAGGRTYLEVRISDRLSGLQAAWLYEAEAANGGSSEAEAAETAETDEAAEAEKPQYFDEMKLYGAGVHNAVATYDITDRMNETDTFYLDLIDYAFNWMTFRIDWREIK